MRIAAGLAVVGTLMVGACAASTDVRSTGASSNGAGEQLPPVDDITPPSTTSYASTTVPGERPVVDGSLVLLASDLPGWDVVRPMTVPEEPTWEALDCPDMNLAWSATGRAGTRSRGTNGVATFRNTAVEFSDIDEAGDVLDAVDRVWTECTSFEADLGDFWSEPIAMPPSTRRSAGIVIGGENHPGWTLAFWQVDTTVIALEIEGDEMWTHLDPLLAAMTARLDVFPLSTVPVATLPNEPADTTTTLTPTISAAPDPTIAPTTAPQSDVFPPDDEDWAEHALAHLAPAPTELGPDWQYLGGSSSRAEPADPDDAIDGCDAPVPPTLDGYEVRYRSMDSEAELEMMVGHGTVADSQAWITSFRAIADCDLGSSSGSGSDEFIAAFELVSKPVDGVDDSVILAGELDLGSGYRYFHVIGLAHVGGTTVAMYVAQALGDRPSTTTGIDLVAELLTTTLTES